MHGKLFIRISAVTAYFKLDPNVDTSSFWKIIAILEYWSLVNYFIKSKRKEQLAASELLPEQSSLDKTLKEIVENNDKAEKSCEKLKIVIEVLED